ncbi:MAG: methyltransferase domain-containing protein [Burkholderiales bacterium]|nr:methyltransferase domain-containing protein [Burkholderiales bacterium]
MTKSPYSLPPVKTKRDELAAQEHAVAIALRTIEQDIAQGELQRAATALNTLQTEHPSDARVYIAGWMLAAKAENSAAAVASARRATELAPMSPLGWDCLHRAHIANGNVAAAREAIEQALVLAPANLAYREQAINLAMQQADYATGERHLRVAYGQNPKLPHLKAMIGNTLRYQEKFDEAVEWLAEALADDMDDPDAHQGLALIEYQRGNSERALASLDAALKVRPDDESLRYLRSVVAGEKPAQQPAAMVRSLFERYANRFDQHLVGALKYRVPQQIAGMIVERFPDRTLNLLDLGCGTGLLGAALGPINGYFVGVDLSHAMIEQARRHGVYSRFHIVDIAEALAATDANEYEVIVAADVLVYIGDITRILRDAFKVLRPGGWLFFSCEKASNSAVPYQIEKSMRYSHGVDHVHQSLDASGFTELTISDIGLRADGDAMIPGFLVATRKPPS